MANYRKYWDKLPKFMKGHQTLRADMLAYVETGYKTKREQRCEERPINEANLITSIDGLGWGGWHRPVLDLDIDAALLPSSTEGHYHLYLDKLMTTEQYFKLLDVMAEVGLLEEGYVEASKNRGSSSLRLPWIDKERAKDNAFDPSEHEDNAKTKLKAAEAEVARLKKEIKDDPFSDW